MTHIIPAIDLMDGRCVRLHKGDFEARTDYGDDPLKTARAFARAGAGWLHVVDLDGARDAERRHGDVIAELALKSGMRVQSGGGIRTREQVAAMLGEGVARVVIGSLAITDPDRINSWVAEFGLHHFVIALDVTYVEGVPRPAVRGWTEVTDIDLWEAMDRVFGLRTVLVTDIGRDGVMGGGNIELYREILARRPELKLITSGGVGGIADVQALKALRPEGIVIGKALYEGKFTLERAIEC